jgi:hypothetical protein
MEPCYTTAISLVAGYLAFYIGLVHVLHHLTGVWVYPVLGDVALKYGIFARYVLESALAGVSVFCGIFGTAIVRSLNAQPVALRRSKRR